MAGQREALSFLERPRGIFLAGLRVAVDIVALASRELTQ